MEDGKRTALAAVIACVVLAAVIYSFGMNLFATTPPIVVADPDAVETEEVPDPGGDGSGGILVEVTPVTVQSVVASLQRYESYSRTVAVEYRSGGETVGTVTVQVWADGGWVRSAAALESGTVENSIVGEGRRWLWYGGEGPVYSGRAEEMTADLMQRLPTYEDVLELDTDSITAAGYEEREGQPCIYVEADLPELGYRERYWVSESSGLLMAAETEREGEVVYAMSSQEVVSPMADGEGRFTLPDGETLYDPAD